MGEHECFVDWESKRSLLFPWYGFSFNCISYRSRLLCKIVGIRFGSKGERKQSSQG